MKKILIIFIVLVGFKMSAQQDPQYTQYMYNMSVINPAYAGSTANLSLGLIYRNQWTGLSGAPRTMALFGNKPISKNIGLGLSMVTDQIGPVKETNATADFSYTLQLAGTQRFAFGLKAGATFHNIGLANLDINAPNDPLYSENVSETRPNLGMGIFYYTNKFYFGASIPNLLETVHYDYNGLKFGSEYRHYFITGGTVFDVSENMKFKPSFLIKSAFEAPISFDINANMLFFEKMELGISYRLEDSFSGIINIALSPNIRIGYAYDSVVSDMSIDAFSSHEFLLLVDLKSKKDSKLHVRFF